MPDLEVTIFNQNLKLSYEQNEKERLMKAIGVLNKNWEKFSNLHGKVSDLKIITLISLELQDSIVDVKALKDKLNFEKLNNHELKKEIETKNKELDNNSNTINKLTSEIDVKNEEISRAENMLDEIHDEILQIKSNIIAKHNE